MSVLLLLVQVEVKQFNIRIPSLARLIGRQLLECVWTSRRGRYPFEKARPFSPNLSCVLPG